jgi:hypothetical protein
MRPLEGLDVSPLARQPLGKDLDTTIRLPSRQSRASISNRDGLPIAAFLHLPESGFSAAAAWRVQKCNPAQAGSVVSLPVKHEPSRATNPDQHSARISVKTQMQQAMLVNSIHLLNLGRYGISAMTPMSPRVNIYLAACT